MLNVIGHRKIYLGISLVLVIAAFACIAVFGLKEGIDFRGGTLWRVRVAAESQEVLTNLRELDVTDARVTSWGETGNFLIRMGEISEAEHTRLGAELKSKFQSFEELSFESIGPSIGEELRRKSLIAVVLVLLGISLYIAFAFRKVFRPVSSWKYGWVTLITLLHDVTIPAGLLAVFGKLKGVEIDGNFVVALLVVMGFSVHDTIVVFDRIRENLLTDRGRTEFGEVINASVNQTLARSINTSLTLILVLLALLFLGPENLFYFILTLVVGVTTGIYSSIFVASPLLYVWHKLVSGK